MKRLFLKGLALTLSAAMLLSMTSCSLFDKASKEVTEAADAFCSDLVETKTSKVYKACYEIEDDDEEYYSDLFYNEVDGNEDFTDALSAIQDTISYEVDKKSFTGSTKRGEATIDVVFSIVDYESVAGEEDEWEDADEFIDALENCEDRVEFTITFEFVKDDDEWLVDNFDDVFAEYFEYQDAEINFAIDYATLVDHTVWYYIYEDNIYYNSDIIELDLSLTSEGEIAGWPSLSFDVVSNGTTIYTGTPIDYGSWYECIYMTSDGSYIPEGSYEIIVTDDYGNIVAQETCEIYVVSDYSYTGFVWYCSDDGYTYTNPSVLELDVLKDFCINWTGCYFIVYDSNGTELYESEVDNYGSYVECIYDGDGGDIPAGTYNFRVFTPDGNLIISEECIVQ